MYPYGVSQWRCKGKNHPPSAPCHVPQLLRLDSTGEVSSDDNPMYSERENCPIKTMGSFFDSALRKFGPKSTVTATNLADKKFSMASDLRNNVVVNSSQRMSQNHCNNWGAAPQAWGGGRFIPCLAPRMASQQKMLSELPQCTPLFQSNSTSQPQHQFHPAMRGVHVSSKKYNRYRNCHPNDINMKHGRNNHTSTKNTQQKRDVNAKTDIEVNVNHHSTENNRCEVKKQPLNNKSVPVVNGATFDCRDKFYEEQCTSRKLKDNNIHVLASTASDSHKSTLNDCDIIKAAYMIHDVNSFHQNEEEVPLDWFYGGCSKAEEDSINSENVENLIGSTSDHCEEETRHEDTKCELRSLQRECSILSDQLADGAISMTCLFTDIDIDASQNGAECTESAGAETCTKPVEKEKNQKIEEKTTENLLHNEKEEKTECKKTEDYSFILHVRDNKKWRSSAKKRRRKAKTKKEESEETSEKDNSTKNCKEESSPASKKTGCNTLAFILGFDPKTLSSSPEQTHSFFVSFSESDSDFSEDDGFSDEDQQLNCEEFSCPLDLNVICSITHSHPDSQGRSSDIDAINKLWEVNVKVNSQVIPPRKSNKKVHFAEGGRLCEVHPIIAWSYAYQAARKGPWEEYARDRERFQRRVMETEKLLAPVFDAKKREAFYKSSVLKTE